MCGIPAVVPYPVQMSPEYCIVSGQGKGYRKRCVFLLRRMKSLFPHRFQDLFP